MISSFRVLGNCVQKPEFELYRNVPGKLPGSWRHPNALEHAVTLFYTGTVGGSGCGGSSIAAGTAHADVTVDSGTVLGFFLIPNRTLAQYHSSPHSGLNPLFSMNRLNPGGFDQVMTFRSQNGRTQTGSSQTVVTAGPMLLFAFDDQAIALRASDQDFDDVVFTVRSVGVAAAEETAGCED